jgi:hypothetical protein
MPHLFTAQVLFYVLPLVPDPLGFYLRIVVIGATHGVRNWPNK